MTDLAIDFAGPPGPGLTVSQQAQLDAATTAATPSVAGQMSAADKAKLNGIAAGAQVNTVASVAGKTGAVTLVKADVGLSNVDNTSDANKPISNATATALAGKASAAQGAKADTALQSGASLDAISESATSKKFSATERTKLAGVAAGATANDTDANLKNRSNHTGAQPISSVTGLQAAIDGKATVAQGAKADAAVQPADLTKAAVGLANVDNTSDAAKPISAATATALAGKATAAQGAKADTAVQPSGLTKAAVGLANVNDTSDAAKPISTATAAALAGKATAAQGAKADTAVQPAGLTKAAVGLGSVDNTSDAAKPISSATATALAGVDARLVTAETKIEPLTALIPQAESRPGDARALFSSALTGSAISRPTISVGTDVNRSDLGAVLRVSGGDVPAGPGYLDVARRAAFAFEEGRTYLVYATIARAVDPSDPDGHGVELRLQNLNGNKASVSNTRLGPVHNPTVDGGPIGRDQTGVLIGKTGSPGALDYTIPPTAVYGTPFVRIYGNGHSTDVADVVIADVTDAIVSGTGIGDASGRLAAIEADLPSRATTAELDTAVSSRVARDGSAGMLDDLPMGGNKLTEVDTIDLAEAALPEDGRIDLIGLPEDSAGTRPSPLSYDMRRGLIRAATDMTTKVDILSAGYVAARVQPGEDGKIGLISGPEDNESASPTPLYYDTRSGLIGGNFDDATKDDVLVGGLEADDDGYVSLLRFKGQANAARAVEMLGVNSRTGQLMIGDIDDDTAERLGSRIGGGGGSTGPGRLGTKSLASVITLIWQNGQSLAVGGNRDIDPPVDEPAYLSVAPYTPYSYMLNTGLRGAMGTVQNFNLITDFIAAQDDRDEIGRGQVFGTSMMAHLHKMHSRSGTVHDMVWRSHAQGGRTIAQLNSASQPFANGVGELQRSIAIAAEYGRAVRLPAVMWTQGEQDNDTSETDYYNALVALLAAYNDAYLLLLPSGHPSIVMILDQTSGNSDTDGNSARWGARMAQYRAMRDATGFYMAGPKYFLPIVDSVHLKRTAMALWGEYQAQCWHQVVTLGNTAFRPVMPSIPTTRSGVTLTVTLRRPFNDALVIDTTEVPAQPGYGFEYSGAAITNVAILDAAAGTIEITLASAVGGTLTYAKRAVGGTYGVRVGTLGNIRDDSRITSTTVPGKYLHNWLVAFEEIVA